MFKKYKGHTPHDFREYILQEKNHHLTLCAHEENCFFLSVVPQLAGCADTSEPHPCDPLATKETRARFMPLSCSARPAAESYSTSGRRAVRSRLALRNRVAPTSRDCCGDYPAVFGWELGGMELGAERSIDDVPFDLIARRLIEAAGRGAVNTVSWHPSNPESGDSAWIAARRRPWHRFFRADATMRNTACGSTDLPCSFASLRSADGVAVPVLFRVRSTNAPRPDSGGARHAMRRRIPGSVAIYGPVICARCEGAAPPALGLFARSVPRCGALHGSAIPATDGSTYWTRRLTTDPANGISRRDATACSPMLQRASARARQTHGIHPKRASGHRHRHVGGPNACCPSSAAGR